MFGKMPMTKENLEKLRAKCKPSLSNRRELVGHLTQPEILWLLENNACVPDSRPDAKVRLKWRLKMLRDDIDAGRISPGWFYFEPAKNVPFSPVIRKNNRGHKYGPQPRKNDAED